MLKQSGTFKKKPVVQQGLWMGEMFEVGNTVSIKTQRLLSGKVVWGHILHFAGWPRTWRMFLRSDRDGAGRQAGRSSWCSVLSPPQPAGKSPWSRPGAPACIQWISSLPLNCCRGSPTGTKHLREIWAQKHPGGEEGGVGVGLDSGDQYDYPANHTESSQDSDPCCSLLPSCLGASYVCECISINAALTATCCELRTGRGRF